MGLFRVLFACKTGPILCGMAATLLIPPPLISFSQEPVFATVETDQIALDFSFMEWSITGGGGAGQVNSVYWGDNNRFFTFADPPDDSGLQIPVKLSTETLAEYADRVAEFLRQNEGLHDDFNISRSPGPTSASELLRMTSRVPGPLYIAGGTTGNGFSGTIHNVTAPLQPPGLHAVCEVWPSASESPLIALASPYKVADSRTEFDLSAAFSALSAHLPAESSIDPQTLALAWGEATNAFLLYFLRTADKYGTPPVARALVKSGLFTCLFGSRTGDLTDEFSGPLCHAYQRRDGEFLVKKVSERQPDWVYFLPENGFSGSVRATVRWSDGTEQAVNPFPATFPYFESGKLWWVASGFRQIGLHLLTPPVAEAEIVGYQFEIFNTQTNHNLLVVEYEIACDCADWGNLFLLMSNGLGGCESVWLRGKTTGQTEAEREVIRRFRWTDFDPQRGDFQAFNARARQMLEVNTGWFESTDWPMHYRQLLLGDCWLIDLAAGKFRPVVVDSKSFEIPADDETLWSLNFSLKMGWEDLNINL